MNVPALRFPEFESDYENAKLGKVASFFKGKGISKADIVEDGATPCIRYGELYTHYGTSIELVLSATNVPIHDLKLSNGGEVIVPASGEDAKDIATASVVLQSGIALGGDLNVIQGEFDGYFLASYISGKRRLALAAMAQGNSVVHLYPSQLATLELSLPSRPEQKKIASFLGAVDAKIAVLRDRQAGLERYKRGLMQALFSQRLRFTKPDGTAFPDWEEATIGGIGKFYYGKSAPKFSLSDDAPTPCVRYGELYSHYSLVIGAIRSKTNIARENLKFSKGMEILVPRVGEDPLDFSMCCLLPHAGVAIGEMISVFETDQNQLFYTYYFRTLKYEFAKMVEGGSVSNLYFRYLEPIKIGKPHPGEQAKIAEALSAMDAKITAVTEQLGQMQAFKKGLLQQMFV